MILVSIDQNSLFSSDIHQYLINGTDLFLLLSKFSVTFVVCGEPF